MPPPLLLQPLRELELLHPSWAVTRGLWDRVAALTALTRLRLEGDDSAKSVLNGSMLRPLRALAALRVAGFARVLLVSYTIERGNLVVKPPAPVGSGSELLPRLQDLHVE